MIVLLTGHRGRLGPAIAARLSAAGHEVRGFDLSEDDDVRMAAGVLGAVRGCEIIVHLAGLAGDRSADPADVMAVNVLGTWNVLLAAEAHGIRRVVYISSGRSLGMLERDPDYLPMDDDHRGRPSLAYGLSKWTAEELCAAFTARSGIDTLCLRPVAIFDEPDYARSLSAAGSPLIPGRVWHLGVHLDLRDLAEAVTAAVDCSFRGHIRLLLAAADIAERQPTLELVAARLPHVPWRGGTEYQEDPYRGLIDISRARRVLGWTPRHLWPGRDAQT